MHSSLSLYTLFICHFGDVGIGPTPAAGQIDPKAIARQAIMK